MHLYLKTGPNLRRTIVLTIGSEEERSGTPSRALVFTAAEGKDSQVVAEFVHKAAIDLSEARKLTKRNVKGCLGLINIAEEIFVVVALSSSLVGNSRPSSRLGSSVASPEAVACLHEVGFYSLTSSTWDEHGPGSEGFPPYHDYAADTTNELGDGYIHNTPSAPDVEHPCLPLTKILSSGSFYYAVKPQWDISTRLSLRLKRGASSSQDISMYDERFVWNHYIVQCLIDLREKLDSDEKDEMDKCQFIILTIQGYVGVFTIPLPAPPTDGMPVVATITLISRLGRKRAGTRFNTRGIDDDGNTANFVETETIFSTEDSCFSYVQVRGSVPLFWEQQGLQTFGQKIQITRPHASQPAFEKHFDQLSGEYHAVHAVNLLGSKENEAILATAYAQHLEVAKAVFGGSIDITNFNFHSAVRIGGHESIPLQLQRLDNLRRAVDNFGFTISDPSSSELISEQTGVFRTNCLDCLDRTNFVQDILSRMTLEQYLMLVRREWSNSSSLWGYHRELWAENGDALSRLYAGTGAINTSFTRSGKRTLAGVLSDATKSVSRAYINTFQDKSKQYAIDMFLGNLANRRPVEIYDPIHDSVRRELIRRLPEYSTPRALNIFIGTWNLNGRLPSESLLPWLFPNPNVEDPDMFVLGFQEIVPLTAQQIIQTDPAKKKIWETIIAETLERRPNKGADYTLLRSEQLVGTALIIFVKTTHLGYIRNVEGTTRKTGLRGMSGNKGAVGIRLDYMDTTYCFVTAHLAAGHANVEERNQDYHTISNGLHFLKGKTIQSHESIIWLADTNYRIDLPNDVVRGLAEQGDLDALVAADQLRNAIDARVTFINYEEGPLLFPPTYRYDLHSTRYDTSEKMRIPAWTDRILFRGSQLDLATYSRAELTGSDHRPVYAIFRASVREIDQEKRAALQRRLLDAVTNIVAGEGLEEKLATVKFLGNAEDFPTPSSDEKSWWEDNAHPEGIFVTSDMDLLRPSFNSNPFDSPDLSPLSSPTPSDEELFTNALALQTPTLPAAAIQESSPAIARQQKK